MKREKVKLLADRWGRTKLWSLRSSNASLVVEVLTPGTESVAYTSINWLNSIEFQNNVCCDSILSRTVAVLCHKKDSYKHKENTKCEEEES